MIPTPAQPRGPSTMVSQGEVSFSPTQRRPSRVHLSFALHSPPSAPGTQSTTLHYTSLALREGDAYRLQLLSPAPEGVNTGAWRRPTRSDSHFLVSSGGDIHKYRPTTVIQQGFVSFHFTDRRRGTTISITASFSLEGV